MGGREATTGDASAVRRLAKNRIRKNLADVYLTVCYYKFTPGLSKTLNNAYLSKSIRMFRKIHP